ncbi:MAG: hypothetical protein U1D35_04355 [Paracoccaceae bacterium]|nr:hypothetical protein [Paracoccaceae bacterium]
MILKIISLFLVGMAVLAMFGRLRFPGKLKRHLPGQGKAAAKPATCIRCGRFLIGKSACDCGKAPDKKE